MKIKSFSIKEWREKHPNELDEKVGIENIKLDIERLELWENVLKTLYENPDIFFQHNGYRRIKK